MFNRILIVVVATLFCANLARAQDAQRVAPKLPPNNPAAKFELPPAPPYSDNNEEVTHHLRGLVFVDSPKKILAASFYHGVDVSQMSLIDSPDFAQLMVPLLGKPLTLGELNDICREVVLYCRAHDRPVVDAIVPQQDVTAGTVQILVLQGHVAQIRAEGNRYFASHLLTSAITAQPGDVISQSQLMDDVDWLNRNPFRHTDVVLERGSEFEQTDVILQTEDHFPLRAYAGYENTGTVTTGEDRYLAGFNWGNAFGWDDQLNYQYTMNSTIDRFQAHSGSFVAPLPWRNFLTLFGNWSSTKVQTDPNVFQTGISWQTSARYEIPLPTFWNASNSFILGGDFKRSNTNAEFGGMNVFASNTNTVQFMLGYNVSRPDPLGSTDASLEGYFSPGEIGGEDNNAYYQTARTGARAQYEYLRLNADRTTNLPAQFSWLTRLQAQATSDPLLGSEQLGVGGMDSVRGYEEREGNADNGFVLSNELHTPPASFFKIAGRSDQLTFLAFIDYGVAWTLDAQPGQPRQENFLGVGPGVSYRIGPWLSIDYAYGWRLADGDPTVHASGRNHLRIVASFTY